MSIKSIKFHPILFSTPMVQAILNGTKTQTRRIVKLPNYHPSVPEKQKKLLTIKDWILYDGNNEEIGTMRKPYKVGDVLWVREKFAPKEIHDEPPGDKVHYFEKDSFAAEKWKPSIFMPKEACRIFLKIKSIRIERLQDISVEDAAQEGAIYNHEFEQYHCYICEQKGHIGAKELCEDGFYINAKDSFKSLWHSINGLNSWKENPYVFAYEFEKIEKPLDFI